MSQINWNQADDCEHEWEILAGEDGQPDCIQWCVKCGSVGDYEDSTGMNWGVQVPTDRAALKSRRESSTKEEQDG